ncbi:MAG: hypothetical protein LBT46_14855, partial [Planctomycetaceae bacterium]|nr:hypothetical protein [Planctomycetaceae bacterium]
MLPEEQLQNWIAQQNQTAQQNRLAQPAQWLPAISCQERIRLFSERVAGKLTPRLPLKELVAAMLGGTGTGKSTLLNALLATQAVTEGKERPTTHEPVLVCHTNADVSAFTGFRVERLNNPLLEGLILIDCPDPDTGNVADNAANSNLALLRKALPYCDVILVTATQQKYRSKCVLDELADAASGSRLVFVQTHADKDTDIREDWRQLLQDRYEPGQMYFVDSRNKNNTDSKDNTPQDGDLQALRQLLTRDLTGEVARRIRLANYYGLAEEAVADCKKMIEVNWHSVQKLRDKIDEERRRFGSEFAEKMQNELTNSRQILESKLFARVSLQWGYSPFSLLLRLYQGLGTMLSGAVLTRVRSPVQLALWGTFEGVRRLHKRKQRKKPPLPPMSAEEMNRLKEAGLILTGFTDDAQLVPAAHYSGNAAAKNVIVKEAEEMHAAVIAEIAADMDDMIGRLGAEYNHFWFRLMYETLLSVMLLFLSARPAKNFFVDSFFYHEPLFGIEYYLISLFWLAAWSAVLLFFFTFSLRKGIVKKIREASLNWHRLPAFDRLFASLERDTVQLTVFRNGLDSVKNQLDRLKEQAEKIDKRLGYLK